MSVPLVLITISDTEPTDFLTGTLSLRKTRPETNLWINPTTGEKKKWNPITEVWDVVPVENHAANHESGGKDEMSQFGTIHVNGNLFASAGGTDKGITQDIVLPEGTLSVKKGIIVGWTQA